MPWEYIDDNLKRLLIQTRGDIGLNRQGQFSGDFQKLMAIFSSKALYPYDDFSRDMYDLLNSCSPIFKEGGHWQPGDSVNNNYFYRVETIASFLKKHKGFIHEDASTDEIVLAPDSQTEDDLFEVICSDYSEYDKGWHQLARLTTSYYSHRNFSWWTNDYDFDKEGHFPNAFEGFDLTAENRWLLEFSFKVGISSDWLSNNMLFLRLDSSNLAPDNIRVPSIIDALLQPIFSPQQLAPKSFWGKAFDLNKDIVPFHREYVIKNIPVENVSYFPVRVDEHTFDSINKNARLDGPMIEALIQNI